jgi:hypothetical protein
VTDEDIYAKKLGKKFEKVRGRLCAAEHDPVANARAIGDYVRLELRRSVEDYGGRVDEAVRMLRGDRSLFAMHDAQARLDEAATKSLGAQHIAQALVRAVGDNADVPSFFRYLAEYGVAAADTRLALQNDFRDDGLCRARFDEARDAAVDACASALAAPYVGQPEKARKSEPPPLEDLLQFVVARREP